MSYSEILDRDDLNAKEQFALLAQTADLKGLWMLCRFACWSVKHAWVSAFNNAGWSGPEDLWSALTDVWLYTHDHKSDLNVSLLDCVTFDYKIDDDMQFLAVEAARFAIGAVVAFELNENRAELEEFIVDGLICARSVNAYRYAHGHVNLQQLKLIIKSEEQKLRELLNED